MARVPTSMSPAKPEGSKKPGKPVKTGKKAKSDVDGDRPGRSGPGGAPQAGPANRVTIALPFSQIRMQEPSAELGDLVTVVGDLVAALQDALPADRYEDLEAQLDSLRGRLR